MPHISDLDWRIHTRIGLDVDETLASSMSHCISELQARGKMLHIRDIEDITSFDWLKLPGSDLTEDEVMDFWRHHSLEGILPVEDSIDGAYTLSQKGMHLYIITARNEHDHRTDTEQWTQKYFPMVHPSDIHFANHISKQGHDKSLLCKSAKITLMIDDDMHNAIDLVENNITCILLEKPWNREEKYEHPLLYRAKDWREIINSLK